MVETTNRRKLPYLVKKEEKKILIQRAIEILNRYSDTRITIRQWFYQLVVSGDIKNDDNNYNRFDRYTVEMREKRNIDPSKIQDRTREILGDIDIFYDTWQEVTYKKINDILNPPTIETLPQYISK